MSISRLIVGLIFILGGLFLIVLAFFITLWTLIYAIPILILGIVLLLNKKEDEIEMRRDTKDKSFGRSPKRGQTKELNKRKGKK